MKRLFFFLKSKNFVLVLSMLLTLHACNKSDVEELENAKPVELFRVNEYNTDMKNFTLAVRNALKNNAGFREFIRDEAMRKIDGDYNVILKKVVDKEISSTGELKSATAEFTVKDLLEEYHPNANTYRLKSGTSVIDELMEEFPYLQISVPVHAKAWDPANYTPVVTFLPLEYSDATTKALTGYHPDGGIVHLCVINEPATPVIVIGQNERLQSGIEHEMIGNSTPASPFTPTSRRGHYIPFIAKSQDEGLPSGIKYEVIGSLAPVAPATPTNLRGFQTGSGIKLVWDMPAGTGTLNTTGYFVYRADAKTQTFSRIHTVIGALNTAFNDNNVLPRRTYSYYVTAHFQGVESGPSGIVVITAPDLPNPVLSFNVMPRTGPIVDLKWDNDHSQYISETRIYKNVIGITNGFQLLRSFDPDDAYFLDSNVRAGEKIVYKIAHVTPMGSSVPKFDVVHVPFRAFGQSSPVYIRQIRFTDWRLERWPAGKPEFSIILTMVNSLTNETVALQPRLYFYFSRRRSVSQIFYGRMVKDWRFLGPWYHMLTFTAVEFDRSIRDKTLKIHAGYNFKNPERTAIYFGEGSPLPFHFDDRGEVAGSSFLSFFDKPGQWLRFQKYGVEILVSDKDE